MDPVLAYRDFPWRPFKFGIIRPLHFVEFKFKFAGNAIFNPFSTAVWATTRYCVYSNVFKEFLSSLPTGKVDRKHAS
jgi:hypothetical protein